MKKILFLLYIVSFNALASSFADGLKLYDAGDYAGAFKIWQELAQNGKSNAQHNLGVMYEKGLGVLASAKQAVYWFEKAASQGHAKSQHVLGAKYFYGKTGLKQDLTKSIYWWENAAAQGIISASYNLGVLYLYADAKFKDKTLAQRWLTEAANAGHVKAKKELQKLINKTEVHAKKEPKTPKIKKQNETSSVSQSLSAAINTEDNQVSQIEPGMRLVFSDSSNGSDNVLKAEAKPKVSKIKSADAGKPAKEISKIKSEVPALKAETTEKNAAKKIAKNTVENLKLEKKPLESHWIDAQPAANYTIQLAVAGSEKKALQFIKQYKLKDKMHFYKIKNKRLYKIITGSYSSNSRAQRAIQKLPPKLRKQGAWPKKFKLVQKEKSE